MKVYVHLLPLLLNDVPVAYLPLFAPCSMQVGDNCCLLQSLKDSPYFAASSDRVRGVADRAGWLDEHLLDLNKIQRCWVYLEPVFGGGHCHRNKDISNIATRS